LPGASRPSAKSVGPAIFEKQASLESKRLAAMKIKLTSVLVDDQEKGLRFYTDVLGFKKKHDIPVGAYRWITVVSPDGPPDVELALEPNANPAARTFQKAMFDQGIPVASFEVDDLEVDFKRLRQRGVAFVREPAHAGPVRIAVFADTCGNLIQLHQPAPPRTK
jgi:catechol 2,3-dioxygenase-like lactoylglutathione lyase family enzyme